MGGFGCPVSPYNNTSPYMQELIVRWYQFGVVSPIFRTHGCRAGQAEVLPDDSKCISAEGMKPQGPQGSCGPNEVPLPALFSLSPPRAPRSLLSPLSTLPKSSPSVRPRNHRSGRTERASSRF